MHRVSQMLSHISDMKNYRSTLLILLGITILAQTSSLFAVSINHSKMRRDLDIAEEALKQILQYKDPNIKGKFSLETDQVRSAYIKDYGVLFIVNASSSGARSFQIGDKIKVNIKRSESGNVTGAYIKEAYISDQNKLRIKKLKDGPIAHIQASDIPFSEDGKKSRLTEFLQTYASTIGQLKDSDNITVILDTQIKSFRVTNIFPKETDYSGNKTSNLLHRIGEFIQKSEDSTGVHTQTDTISFTNKDTLVFDKPHVRVRIVSPDSVGTPDPMHFSIYNSHQKVNARSVLQASVRKSDLNGYQKGSLSHEKFTAKINFQTVSGDTTVIKKVDIFSGIIDKSLGPNQDSPLDINNKALGTYIPSLGAIFSVHKTHNANGPESFKNTMIEILADYGTSLRDVQPNEEVIIHIHNEYPHYAFRSVHRVILNDTPNYTAQGDIYEDLDATQVSPKKFPANLILRVKKKHLNDYTAGKIDLKKLREKITITDH